MDKHNSNPASESGPDFVDLLQVLSLTNKGYIIFSNEDELANFIKDSTIETMCKVVEGLADAWELESLSIPGLTFEHALTALRVAVVAWRSEKSAPSETL